jgi:hypothetical protein
MTDVQAVTYMELSAAAGRPIDAQRDRRMPLIVYVGVALNAEVLWLGLIGWSLLNLSESNARSRDAFQAKYDRRTTPGAHAATQPTKNPCRKVIARP